MSNRLCYYFSPGCGTIYIWSTGRGRGGSGCRKKKAGHFFPCMGSATRGPSLQRSYLFETERPDLRFLNSDRPGLMVADPAAAG